MVIRVGAISQPLQQVEKISVFRVPDGLLPSDYECIVASFLFMCESSNKLRQLVWI